MKPGDICLAYTTVPERASPVMAPVRVELVESMPWYERTLWRCEVLEETHRGSRWLWDEEWLQPVEETVDEAR
jgi:hypothetical protein